MDAEVKASGRPGAASGSTIIGWRETVGLPDLGLDGLAGKIDSGARTTALHATRIRLHDIDGVPHVEFLPPHASHVRPDRLLLPLHDERDITNTGGQPETRVVIRTTLAIAGRRWKIDVSLTDRSGMGHPIIIGRTAIRRHRLLVDVGRSWLTAPPPHAPKRR